jgi:hypothetical protein
VLGFIPTLGQSGVATFWESNKKEGEKEISELMLCFGNNEFLKSNKKVQRVTWYPKTNIMFHKQHGCF